MPRSWHDRRTVNKIEDEDKRDFYRSIVADKKPYFMRYIYPALMKQYNTYINNTNRNALREFQMTVPEMQEMSVKYLTDKQLEFLRYYNYRMPVGTNDCVMNKICRRFEDEFDGYISKHASATKFDYTIMRCDKTYTARQYASIKKLYESYNKRIHSYVLFAAYERIDDYDAYSEMVVMNDEFKKECDMVCADPETLCNIILDICYTKNATKRFAWSMCGHEIINNLLSKNDNIISFPVLDPGGDIEYCGNRFRLESKEVDVTE